MPLASGVSAVHHDRVSYCIAVWDGEPPTDDAHAAQTFAMLFETSQHSWDLPNHSIDRYVQALRARWPDIDDEDDEKSPWADGPLRDSGTGPLLYLGLRWSMAEEAATYCAGLEMSALSAITRQTPTPTALSRYSQS